MNEPVKDGALVVFACISPGIAHKEALDVDVLVAISCSPRVHVHDSVCDLWHIVTCKDNTVLLLQADRQANCIGCTSTHLPP